MTLREVADLAGPGGGLRGLLRRYDDGRGLSASVVTALVARVVGVLTGILAVPIALHTLGDARFAIFLVLFGFTNWLYLGSFGVQSALGRLIAADGDAAQQSELLGAAIVFGTIASLAVSTLVCGGLIVWARGQDSGAHSGELYLSIGLMVVMTTLQVILQVFEGVRIGRLSIYVTNLTRLFGSLVTIVCLLVLPRLHPSMVVFVLAMNGGLLLSAALNALLVLRTVQPSFRGLGRNLGQIRKIATSGTAFTLISIAGVMQLHMPLLVLTQVVGAAASADFGVLMRLLLSMIAIISAVTMPLWPALMRARAEQDEPWIRRAMLWSGAYVGAAGVGVFLLLTFFGAWGVGIWTGRVLHWEMLFQASFGLLFLLLACSNYWGNVLVGQGREWLVAIVLWIEAPLMNLFTAIGGRMDGASGAAIGLVLAVACVSFWIFPLAAILRMRQEGRLAAGATS